MQSKDYNLKIAENLRLVAIDGETEYIKITSSDLKEFYQFQLMFDVGKRDHRDIPDLLVIEITREQFNNSTENFQFKVCQLPDNTKINDFPGLLKDQSLETIKDTIREFINEYESQGFDA